MNADDILARLRPESERRLHMTWSRHRSWPRFIGWNPAAELTFARTDPRWRERLERFVRGQRKRGRLLVGFFSYDLGVSEFDVRSRHRSQPTPDGYVAAFGNYLAGGSGGLQVVADDPTFRNAVESIRRRPAGPVPSGPAFSRPLRPTMSRTEYGRAFRAVQRHIKAGDVYQLNLTHRLEGRTALAPLDLFRRVRAVAPGALSALIEGDAFSVVSASPERFVRIADGVITTAPVKGTRPRGGSPAADRRHRRDLLSSDKERAELSMITDLLRNDLGKICRPGSVSVTARRRLTAHPTVWHTHSEITGRVRRGRGPIAALLELLPGGSISGCPKKRAVEIIDDVEPASRGVYTGTIFTLQPDGTLDSSIAIRTLLQSGDSARLSVGGGLVYGSTEAAEYQESLDKAKVFTEL